MKNATASGLKMMKILWKKPKNKPEKVRGLFKAYRNEKSNFSCNNKTKKMRRSL